MSRKRKIKTEPGTSSLPIDVDDQQASPSSSSSTATQELARAKKKFKTTLTNLSEQLKCPISRELMVDPVLAADGKTYERTEIEQWLESESPYENEQARVLLKFVSKLKISNDVLLEWITYAGDDGRTSPAAHYQLATTGTTNASAYCTAPG